MKNLQIENNEIFLKIKNFFLETDFKKFWLLLLKILNSGYLLAIIFILFLISFVMTNFSATGTENFDFMYANADAVLASSPHLVNTEYDKNKFFLPMGYTMLKKEGVIFSKNDNIFELGINVDLKNTFYEQNYNSFKINDEKVFLYKKESDNLNMYIWQKNETTDQVILVHNKSYIAGNIKKKNIENSIEDMAIILNSVK